MEPIKGNSTGSGELELPAGVDRPAKKRTWTKWWQSLEKWKKLCVSITGALLVSAPYWVDDLKEWCFSPSDAEVRILLREEISGRVSGVNLEANRDHTTLVMRNLNQRTSENVIHEEFSSHSLSQLVSDWVNHGGTDPGETARSTLRSEEPDFDALKEAIESVLDSLQSTSDQ